MRNFEYIKEGMKSEAHTPVYKMHKYFARRPQNVFRALAENYSKPGDTILDVFCGGGVTLFEGVSIGRKVIANDINPLAVFVSDMEVTQVDKKEYLDVIKAIREDVKKFSDGFFSTHDRETGKLLPVRWYELAYKVKCPECGKEIVLSNENKTSKAGIYHCNSCGNDSAGVDCANIGAELISVTYKITTRATQRTVEPDEYDRSIVADCETNYKKYVEDLELWIPDIEVPETWDRQQEDCLYRKGVVKFEDFFMKRSLIVMGYFLKKIHEKKDTVSDDVFRMLLLTFSATLRYTNNLTISTNAWQDGRPVAWAKHAYWLSYQFVEVNPIEYIDKRVTAIKAAIEYQMERLPKLSKVRNQDELNKLNNSYILLNQDSANLPIKNESVDLVLTDPPYGSNVQYGELSAFWLAWLYPDLNLEKSKVVDLSKEILVNRKKSKDSKDHEYYYQGLLRVFKECYRVLKDGAPLVFTFNNKDPKVWMAVMKAALEAGFVLEDDGVIYQEPIENYINTAHTKYSGALLGDFIYTFLKDKSQNEMPNSTVNDSGIYEEIETTINKKIVDTVSKQASTTNEIYIAVFKQIIPLLASLAMEQKNFKYTNELFKSSGIEDKIKKLCAWDETNNKWRLE